MIDKAALPPRREARVYEGEKEVMGRSGSDGGVFGSGVLCVMRMCFGRAAVAVERLVACLLSTFV